MGYTFTFGEIMKICRALKMEPVIKSGKTWRGIDSDGRFRQTYIHSHGGGKPVADGTAKRIADQLYFDSVKEMHSFLQQL